MLRKSARLEARQLKQAAATTTPPVEIDTHVNNNSADLQDLHSHQEDQPTVTPQKRKRQTKKKQTHSDKQSSAPTNDNTSGGLEEKKKRQTKKKQTHSDKQSSAPTNGNTSGGLEEKKKRRPKKLKETTLSPPSVASSPVPEPELPVAVVVNKSDPCAVLPTELWHRILSLLPLSMAAQTSTVSKTWLHGTRSSPIWKAICDKGELGKPKKKFKSYMALACAHSYWVCEGCFSVTKGRPRGSDIPLPVSFPVKTTISKSDSSPVTKTEGNGDGVGDHGRSSGVSGGGYGDQSEQNLPPSDRVVSVKQEGSGATGQKGQTTNSNIWMLCITCRRMHFYNHREALRHHAFGSELPFQEETRKITKTGACDNYGLNAEDLGGLIYEARRNPYRRNGIPMRLYDRDEIQNLALRIHAGWVGVDAVRYGVARARHERFNRRIKGYGYVAPQVGYVVPQEEYVAPQEGYVAPQEGYVVPQEGYVVPQEGYVAPQEGYVVPQEGYVAPHENSQT
jgi:hypothetical protein